MTSDLRIPWYKYMMFPKANPGRTRRRDGEGQITQSSKLSLKPESETQMQISKLNH
jgi:hypothetical protein